MLKTIQDVFRRTGKQKLFAKSKVAATSNITVYIYDLLQ